MLKGSDICILLATIFSFVLSAFLWITGDIQQAIFTAIWVPSILAIAIYLKLLCGGRLNG